MARRQAARLGDLLIDAGALTKDQLQSALGMQRRMGGRLGSTLIEMGLVSEGTIASVLAQQMQIPSATAAQLDRAAKGALERVSRGLAERCRVIPIRIDGDRLWVAMVDPTDENALAAIERESGLLAKPMVAPDVLVDFALGKHYGVQRRTRFVEARNADLLEVESAPVYDPLALGTQEVSLGFLDEQRAKPPQVPKVPSKPPALPSSVKAPRMQDSLPHIALEEPAPPPGDNLRTKLLATATQDEVYDALLDELVPAVPRLALLLLRDGILTGHRSRALDPRVLGKVKIDPQDSPSISSVLDTRTPLVGPLPGKLDDLFQGGTQHVLLLPLAIGKKPMGLVIGAPVTDVVSKRVSDLERVIAMVDLALHMAHLRARLSRT